ncbi:MAG: hypothetical protein ACLQGP_20175 [Isosphaeraceae bacterium]
MSVAQEQTVLDKIRTRGYWRVVIRPKTFEKKHIRIPDHDELFLIVGRNSVRLREWGYPHIDYKSQPLRGADWVGQGFECQHEIEVWRLYMSGQFVHFFALAGEWRDQSKVWPRDPRWKAGRFMYYVQTLYSFVEILEFAARLALSPAGAALMHVEIDIEGLQGRHLDEPDPPFQGTFSRDYTIDSPNWNYCWEGTQTELIAEPRELAAVAAQDLFARFGLDLSLETLARVQARIGR